jgi:hypothetical protein
MAYLMHQQRRGKHTQTQFYFKKVTFSIIITKINIILINKSIYIYIKGQCIPAHVLQNSSKNDTLTFIDKSVWQDSIALKISCKTSIKTMR